MTRGYARDPGGARRRRRAVLDERYTQPSRIEEIPVLTEHPAKCRELAVPHTPLEVAFDRAHVGVPSLDLLGCSEGLLVDLLGRSSRIAGFVAVSEEQVSLVPDAVEELLLGREDLALGANAVQQEAAE